LGKDMKKKGKNVRGEKNWWENKEEDDEKKEE
jgi:hypothetical protein